MEQLSQANTPKKTIFVSPKVRYCTDYFKNITKTRIDSFAHIYQFKFLKQRIFQRCDAMNLANFAKSSIVYSSKAN